jgi:hypothetical protein
MLLQPLHVAMHDVVLPAVPKPGKVLPERHALRRLGSNRRISALKEPKYSSMESGMYTAGLARDPREGLGDVFPRGAVGGNLNVLPRGLVWVVKHPTREEAEVLKRDERDMPITEGKSPHRCPVLSPKRYKELRKRKSVQSFRPLPAIIEPTYPTRQHFHVRTVGVRRPDHPIWVGSLSLQEIGDTSLAVVVAAPVLRLESASL